MGDEAIRTAAVTGASGGIGRAIAEALGALGWVVAIGARRAAQLEETASLVEAAGGRPYVHPLDVCTASSVDDFFDAVEGEHGPVDVLVNNAGIAWAGAAHEMVADDHRRIVETNLVGPILCTRRVVARLREEGRRGDVVQVSSDATANPRPHLATYSASKAGLESFSAAFAMECEGSGIRCSVVRVGPTLSGFADDWDPDMFATLMPYWQRFGIQRHFNTMDPADVGRAVVQVVTAPEHMWVPLVEVQPQPPLT